MSAAELLQRVRSSRSPLSDRRDDAHQPVAAPRDRFIDVLRVGSILIVVLLHWLMPVLSYDDGRLDTGNALAQPGAWTITWLAQVMPFVFFAGGAAAVLSITRRRVSARQWVARRLVRLAWPVMPLAAVWVPLPYVLRAVGVPGEPLDTAARTVGQLLWFLAVYVVIVALTPVLVRAHRTWHGREIIVLAVAAAVIDVVRFSQGDGIAGYANVILVWAVIYQMGIAYGAGRLRHLTTPKSLALAAAAFAVTAIAVGTGPYPSSMIGMPGAPLSNMNPPSAVLISLAIGQLALAYAAKPAIERWAKQTEIARALDHLSGRLMTIYLWHMPALMLVAWIAVIGYGFETPAAFGEAWRDVTPRWIAALAVVLVALVGAFGRFEHPPRPRRHDAPSGDRVEAAAVLIGLGLLVLTIVGFRNDGPPAPALAAVSVAAGIALLRVGRPTDSIPYAQHERLDS